MTAIADDLKPYAPADEGYQRMVFRVPALDNEADSMVEVMVGKIMEVDCNRIIMGGKLLHNTVKGFKLDKAAKEKLRERMLQQMGSKSFADFTSAATPLCSFASLDGRNSS